jgi:hypothetical protein
MMRGTRKVARVKTLITLSVLQTIGIAALVAHAFREEHPAAPDLQPSITSESTIGSSASTDEQRLRAIIREELTRLQSELGTPAETPTATPAPSRPRDPAVDQQRHEAVAQQIENYRSAGAITDTQMQELQTDIAQLEDASRKQMLSKLIRALNAGDIKGRL